MRNGVMMQYFEWNIPNHGNFWLQLKNDASHLFQIGITAVWLPPACKSIGNKDVGYGIYDLYDLGEFDQKGSVRTKYGTKAELIEAIDELHKHNISVYFDVVINHKAGADYTETFSAVEVDPINRNNIISSPLEIEGWTGFDFRGRNDRYSKFKWHKQHFTGIDFDNKNKKKAIYMIVGENKGWSPNVDTENGNYDYLMYADIDYKHPEVVDEVKNWANWLVNELHLDGIRLDAIKHIDRKFIKDFIDTIRKSQGSNFYVVGEYWKRDLLSLDTYLKDLEYKLNLFDVPLHYNLKQIADAGKTSDLSKIMSDSLVNSHPELAVTFVDNHDSQSGSSLDSQIQDWFKPPAYALILLMKEGYPCIFYGDYYGIGEKESAHHKIIDKLLIIRNLYAHGEQVTFFDEPGIIAIQRKGDKKHPGSGLVLLISNSGNSQKIINLGTEHKGEIWCELLDNKKETLTLNEKGEGQFSIKKGNVAVWAIKSNA